MPGLTGNLIGSQRSVVPCLWKVEVSCAIPWSTRMRIRVKDTGYGSRKERKISVDGQTGGEVRWQWLTISWTTYERKASVLPRYMLCSASLSRICGGMTRTHHVRHAVLGIVGREESAEEDDDGDGVDEPGLDEDAQIGHKTLFVHSVFRRTSVAAPDAVRHEASREKRLNEGDCEECGCPGRQLLVEYARRR